MIANEDTEFTKGKYPHSKVTDAIIKCAIEVHKTLGPGFIEDIYENALICELKNCGLRVEQQKQVPVQYKGKDIGIHRIDLLVENEVVVENKEVRAFDEIHLAQILSYLKAVKKRIGLLLNVVAPKVRIKRVIL